jgi:hypothetical protein
MYSSKEVLVQLLFKTGPCDDRVGGREGNQAKADSERDSGNKRIFKASLPEASPHWTKNRLICSIVITLSCLENLVKSGILYQWGIAT